MGMEEGRGRGSKKEKENNITWFTDMVHRHRPDMVHIHIENQYFCPNADKLKIYFRP
jgi:hypothetical protein